MDFSNAPEGAAYQNIHTGYFYYKGEKSAMIYSKSNGGWCPSEYMNDELDETSKFTPIPQQSYMPAVGEWSGEGLPPEKYLIEAMVHDKWEKCKVLITDDNHQECAVMVIRNAELAWADNFRPLPTEEEVEREKILSAWKGQSLRNAHDTMNSVLPVSEMIDFMMAYRLQESE